MPLPIAMIVGRMATLFSVADPRGRVKLAIRVDGADGITLSLQRLGERITDFRRFWVEYWGPQFFDDIQKNFASSGRMVGGWRALSPRYAAWKAAHYGNRPILTLTGAMRESFRIGGRGNVFKPGARSLVAGSTDPKVRKHQYGQGVPVRKVIFMQPGRVYQRLLGEYVREEARASGLRNVRAS